MQTERNVPETIKLVCARAGTIFTFPYRPARYSKAIEDFNQVRSLALAGVSAMNLDVNTLFLVTIYVEAILGLLLLFAWVQNTQISAVAWWGCAHLLRACSVMLFGMYGSVSEAISIDLANALLLLSFAVTWSGSRVFDGRPVLPMHVSAPRKSAKIADFCQAVPLGIAYGVT